MKWEEITLKDVAFYRNDKVKSDELSFDNYVSTENMIENRGGVVPPSSTPTSGSSNIYLISDILVSNIRPYFKKIWFADKDGACSNDVLVFTTKNKSIDTNFLYYRLSTDDFFDYVMAGSNGVKMPRGNKKSIMDYKFLLPPLKTQKKIASLLSNYDKLIENNTQRIKLLESMAEELYKEWFVQLRFPDHDRVELVDGLPVGWEKVKLSSFGKIITGKTPSTKNSSNFTGNIPFIKTPDFKQGIFVINTEQTLSNRGADTQKSQYVQKNSISVSCIGTVGEIGIVTKLSQTNQQINTIEPKDERTLEYLYMTIIYLKPLLESFASSGATMGNLSKTKFSNMEVLKPSLNMIIKYHYIIKDTYSEIKILQYKNQTLKQTRDLLLPRLMSGKLNVEDLDII